jgi:YgiT-type zinc finger domain-containing protein
MGFLLGCARQSIIQPAMNACTSCNQGTLAPGATTATFETEGTTVVIRNVPAEICDACGEGSFDADTSERLLELAAAAAEWSGAPVQICDYE